MIVKFFKGEYSSEKNGLKYLEGGTKTRKTPPVLLKGNPELTREYLKIASKFSKPYTYGCLAFEEKDIPSNLKLILMDEFERVMMAGLDPDQFDVVWIEHKDKGGVELNFHVVNMELTTQKSLTPYFHRRDIYRIDAWKNIVNDRFGFTNPHDPRKKRTFAFGNNPRPRIELMTQIDNHILDLALDGELNNQNDVLNALNEIDGITVTRTTKSSISFIADGYKKPIRLKGDTYGKNFRGVENLKQQQEERIRRFEAGRDQRIKDNKQKLRNYIKTIVQQRRAKYPKFVQEPTEDKLAVSDVVKPDHVSDRIGNNIVSQDIQHQPIPEVSPTDQEQRHRGDLLPDQENKKTKLNNDANNNNQQHESPESWVQRLINSFKQTIISIGKGVKSLRGVNLELAATSQAMSGCFNNVRENANTIDRLIRETGAQQLAKTNKNVLKIRR